MEDEKNAGILGPWTSDWILQQDCIGNIDRSRDLNSRDLFDAASTLEASDQVRLSLAHRFTQSRPGNPQSFCMQFADLCEVIKSCKCGTTYQPQLSRREIRVCIDCVVEDIMGHAPFECIDACSDFIASRIVVVLGRRNKPRFHSTEVAKDICQFTLTSHFIIDKSWCSLGPGARRG